MATTKRKIHRICLTYISEPANKKATKCRSTLTVSAAGKKPIVLKEVVDVDPNTGPMQYAALGIIGRLQSSPELVSRLGALLEGSRGKDLVLTATVRDRMPEPPQAVYDPASEPESMVTMNLQVTALDPKMTRVHVIGPSTLAAVTFDRELKSKETVDVLVNDKLMTIISGATNHLQAGPWWYCVVPPLNLAGDTVRLQWCSPSKKGKPPMFGLGMYIGK